MNLIKRNLKTQNIMITLITLPNFTGTKKEFIKVAIISISIDVYVLFFSYLFFN